MDNTKKYIHTETGSIGTYAEWEEIFFSLDSLDGCYQDSDLFWSYVVEVEDETE